MPWVINPTTQKPIKVNSRFYKFIIKNNTFRQYDHIKPLFIPPNKDIDSNEFRAWVFDLYAYYKNNEKAKTPMIEIQRFT